MKVTLLLNNLFLICLMKPGQVSAQGHNPVKWRCEAVDIHGSKATLMFTASLEEGWHIYAVHREDGLLPTSFLFAPGDDYKLMEGVKEKTIPSHQD